jgi:glycosyltransferase involved in cell wall biosynthesis
MRIVIIISLFPPKWLGGMEIATYNIAEHLAKKGHEIHVITQYDEGLQVFSQENGFYIHRIAFSRVRIVGVLLLWLRFFLTVRKIKPDIIHAQSFMAGIPACVIGNLLRIPYIVWGRGSDVYLMDFYVKNSSKFILKNANAIIALTDHMRKKLNSIHSRDIYIVPNGISLEQFKEISPDLTNEARTKKILFVGRFHPVKGVKYLIMAMEKVHEEIPDARLILVGDGKERDMLEKLAENHGIRESIDFIGEVPHKKIAGFMNNADVFVLPSISESFGMVNLEAMACGLPIVASRVGGIPNVIKDEVHGYLVEAKKPDEIAEKLLLLLQNTQLRMKISQRNKEDVKAYAWDNIANSLEKIYLKVLMETDKKIKNNP